AGVLLSMDHPVTVPYPEVFVVNHGWNGAGWSRSVGIATAATGQPIFRAQLIDDRAANPGADVEIEALLGTLVAAAQRIPETPHASRDQVVALDAGRGATVDLRGNPQHHRTVLRNQLRQLFGRGLPRDRWLDGGL